MICFADTPVRCKANEVEGGGSGKSPTARTPTAVARKGRADALARSVEVVAKSSPAARARSKGKDAVPVPKGVAGIPVERTAEEKKRRDDLFMQFDPNGNGYLSLAECDKGVIDILGLKDAAKPAIMRAYQLARDVRPSEAGSVGSDYVSKSEFRVFLLYLKQHLELWEMFKLADAGDDRRIDLGEFKASAPLLREWGLEVSDDVEATFKEVDADGGGQILFVEFAAWAIKKKNVSNVYIA